MKLHTKTLLASLTATAMLAGSADAANILYVGDGSSGTAAFLSNNGNTVTEFDSGTYGFNLGSNGGVAFAESFDLVVVGRTTNFGSIRPHGAVWNALDVPMINLNMFLVGGQFSAGSWSWTGGGANSGGSISGDTIAFLDASDPVFASVPANTALYDGDSRYWLPGGAPLAGVEILATESGVPGNVAVAYAAPGSLQAGGAAQYFIAGTGGESDDETFTANGEQVLLNAVNTLVPEPSSLALLGLGGLLIARRRRG